MEEEEKNNQDSFIKEQTGKLREKGKEEAKKQAMKKIIIPFVTAHATVFIGIGLIIAFFGIILWFAISVKIIGDNKVKEVSNAKTAAINFGLGATSSTTDDSWNIKFSKTENGVYAISNNYTPEELDSIKVAISKGGRDVSDFSDFEVAIIGALINSGLNTEKYTVEQLKCFPLFIRAEGCTSYLDLRPNSKKFDNYGNYMPEKLENLKENEIPGIILVQRTNTREDTPVSLEYMDLDSFTEMKNQNDLNILNYFTINEGNNLVIAKWKYKKVEVDGEYPSGVAGTSESEEYTIQLEEIPYTEYVRKYTMPFDFLAQLLFTTDEADFCRELTKIVNNSKIVINIQEAETKTIEEDIQTYTVYHKEETTTKSAEDKDDSQSSSSSNTTETSSSSGGLETQQTGTATVTTTEITHEYGFEITEADTWLVHYIKKYKKSVLNKYTEGPITSSKKGEYGSPSTSTIKLDDGQIEETKSWSKVDEEHVITTQIEEYPSDPDPSTKTHIYSKDKDGNFEKFLLILDKYSYSKAMLNSIDSWLYDRMKSSTSTEAIVDYIKYILYVYDGIDRGVTDLDTEIFEPDEFTFNSDDGTEWWWPIGSSMTTGVKNGLEYATGKPVETMITSTPGERLLDGKKNTHNGLDIAGPRNTNIIVAKSGQVIKVVDGYGDGNIDCRDGGGYGNHVFIRLDDGKVVKYAHLEKGTITVKKGDYVQQGQIIGKMGTSGMSTGVHLHFEIRDANGNVLYPQNYIDSNNPRPGNSSNPK